MAQMCLVKDAMFPEGWAGTLRTPLSPRGGLMSSLLLTGFMGELSCGERSRRVSPRQANARHLASSTLHTPDSPAAPPIYRWATHPRGGMPTVPGWQGSALPTRPANPRVSIS